MKKVNLWFEGMLITGATLRKSFLCSVEQIDVTKDGKYIGRLDTDTHKLVYRKELQGINYTIEKRV